jgi:hypothetical protein
MNFKLGGWLLLAACADFSRGAPLADGSAGSSMGAGSDAGAPTGVSYGADIHPLLMERCGSCHSPTGAASGTALVFTGSVPDDYLSTFNLVSVETPEASRLAVKMAGRGHQGGAIITSASPEYARVLRWIGEGAAQ